MPTKVKTGLATGSAPDAAAQIVRAVSSMQPSLLAVFASTRQSLPELAAALSSALKGTTIVSANTAGEITETGAARSSVSYFALSGDFKIHAGIGRGLSNDVRSAVTAALVGHPSAEPGYPHRVGLILLDALTGKGEEAVLTASMLLGPDVKVAGGAAGDDLGMKHAPVGLGSQTATDAVVLVSIFSKAPIGLGVAHGHTPQSEQLTVTKASGSVVQEVNSRPAWEVWKESAGAMARAQGFRDFAKMDGADESAFLLRYEAGLAAGGEYKIRAPLSRTPEGALNFACGLPEGAVFRITESTPDSQSASALEAARRAVAGLGGAKAAGALVFDCICRSLILDKRYGEVAKDMSKELGSVALAGFATYGEIALDAGDFSGFHNTTSVVLAFA